MTIQEAIKSGKPFRRKAIGEVWWIHSPDHSVLTAFEGIQEYCPDMQDILADDWEIKPDPVTFEARLDSAQCTARSRSHLTFEGPAAWDAITNLTNRRLRVTIEVIG